MQISKITTFAANAQASLSGVAAIYPAADMTFALERRLNPVGDAECLGDDFAVVDVEYDVVSRTTTLYNEQLLGAWAGEPLVHTVPDYSETALEVDGLADAITGVSSEYEVVVYLDGVELESGTDYTLDEENGTITFGTAPVQFQYIQVDFVEDIVNDFPCDGPVDAYKYNANSSSTGALVVEVNDGTDGAWAEKTLDTDYTVESLGEGQDTYNSVVFADGYYPTAGEKVRISHTFALWNTVVLDNEKDSEETIKVYVDGTLKTLTTDYTIDSSSMIISFATGKEPSLGEIVTVFGRTAAMAASKNEEVSFNHGRGGYGYQAIVPTAQVVAAVLYG